ncbi:LacI family DNA-binding transcriptional regulator [Archangium violaceum]|uniref:LacI family DNA-binding transcriptional regulator n=1 Tax=Archangium violaceum TaxID=83451 RepID=UPI00193BBF40|nr:LacI family DNA-binding transcriptional regulator [Archangium violaceum]QRK07419.1 LacI family DNA-binding transcriptional regulator [Archangium violaceum]
MSAKRSKRQENDGVARTAGARANLRTLATHLGLSISTVSRALKDGPEVRPETIQRVKEAAARFGYVPNIGGIHLRTGRTFKVCSILYAPEVGDYGEPGFLAQVETLSNGIEPAGYNLIVLAQTGQQTPLDPVRKIYDQRLADAVVFSRTTPMDERARFCLEKDFPFVSFGRTELQTPHAFVDHDDEYAVFDAVMTLARGGHRRIVLLNPSGGFNYVGLRLRGYRRALAEAGLPWDESLVYHGDLSVRGTREAIKLLLERVPSVTAIVCGNQMSIVGTLEGLLESGRDTKKDGLSVVGFGGMPFLTLSEQHVTYYYQPQSRVGTVLASHLKALLNGQPAENLQTVLPYARIDDLRLFRTQDEVDLTRMTPRT